MESGLVSIHFNKARQELALVRDIDEVKEIRDRAEALRVYARQAGESLEMQNMCAEIKLRAERRAGELLKEQGIKPGNPQFLHDARIRPKLADIGIEETQSHRWQRIADIPEDIFEKHIGEYKDAKQELTTASVLRLARDVKETEMKQQMEAIAVPDGTYRTLVIDPPWPMQKILRDVAPDQVEFDYPTMTLNEICLFPVEGIAMPDAHLFLWTTQKYLPYTFDMLESWGFQYIFTMVWHKSGGFQPFGLPQYNCEFVVYSRRGTIEFIETTAFMTCFNGKRREHSRKPDEFYELVKRVTQEPRIDIFSREKREGFDQYGDEPAKFEGDG